MAILIALWSNVQWIFTAWIPAWWRVVENDVQALNRIGW